MRTLDKAKTILLVLAVLMPLAAFAGDNKVPSQKDLDMKYPSVTYLKAFGTGGTEEDARNNAVSELSKIFDSKIVGETVNKIKTVAGTQKKKESKEQSYESQVKIYTSVKLQGVEVVMSWYDPDKKQWRALAVLDKMTARDNWMKEIGQIDAEAGGLLKTAEGSDSKLMKIKNYGQAINLWVKREVVAVRIRILGYDDAKNPPYDIKLAYESLPKIKSTLPLLISFKGESAPNVTKRVSNGLSSAGFVITNDRNKAEALINGDVTVERIPSSDKDWVFVTAMVSVKIIDLRNNLTVIDITEDARSAQLSFEEAVKKATAKAATSIVKKILDKLEYER